MLELERLMGMIVLPRVANRLVLHHTNIIEDLRRGRLPADRAKSILASMANIVFSSTAAAIATESGHLINGPLPDHCGHNIQTGADPWGNACVFKIFPGSGAATEFGIYEKLHGDVHCPFLARPLRVLRLPDDRSALVMPFYGFSLVSLTHREPTPARMLRIAVLSGACALMSCHLAGYCFADMKPEHIAVYQLGCVLLDAGSAVRFRDPISRFTPIYSLGFPPIGSEEFDLRCFASTIIQLVTGCHPPAWGILFHCSNLQNSMVLQRALCS